MDILFKNIDEMDNPLRRVLSLERVDEARKLKTMLDNTKSFDKDLANEPKEKILEVVDIVERTIDIHKGLKWTMEENGRSEAYGLTISEINRIIDENASYKCLLEEYLNFECTIRIETKKEFVNET